MNELIKGIVIKDNFFEAQELPLLCREKSANIKLPAWERKIFSFIADFLNDSDHIIQESSGTTGRPKKYRLPKKAMIHSAQQTIKFFGLHEKQTAMLCLPVDYIAGKMMIIRALLAGMQLVYAKPSSFPEIKKAGRIDFCAMVPLQVLNLMTNGFDLSHIKTLIIGGAELSPETELMLHDISTSVYETFGMAETCSHIALRKVNGAKPERFFTTLPDISISSDQNNCLVIEASYLPHPVVTHDIVEIIDQRHFRWLGRLDNLINSGGFKISPEIIEKTIYQKTGQHLYLVGLPDIALGLKPALVSGKDLSDEEKQTVLTKIKDILTNNYIIPEIFCVPSLPATYSMKINRKKLAELVINL